MLKEFPKQIKKKKSGMIYDVLGVETGQVGDKSGKVLPLETINRLYEPYYDPMQAKLDDALAEVEKLKAQLATKAERKKPVYLKDEKRDALGLEAQSNDNNEELGLKHNVSASQVSVIRREYKDKV